MRLLDVVLPLRCAVCSTPGEQLCGACLAALPRIAPPSCERCGAPAAWPVGRCRECSGRRLAFASARAAVTYDEAVRAFVSAWKERGLRRLAPVAAELVAERVAPPRVTAVTAIPPDGDRSVQRGHHPAERLAAELARRWELPLLPLIHRRRPVARQRGLSVADRRRNVARAFAARGRAPARVALVDDVYTTGATVSAAASALRSAGARRVEVVTFARALRGR
jgi:predicted amidophosphoribosyltransferase